jgi:hypothetical protein
MVFQEWPSDAHDGGQQLMQPTLRNLKRIAEKQGGWVDVTRLPDKVDIQVHAPEGSIWKEDGLHTNVNEYWIGDDADRDVSIADAIVRVQSGLEPCTDEECDVCRPEEDQ